MLRETNDERLVSRMQLSVRPTREGGSLRLETVKRSKSSVLRSEIDTKNKSFIAASWLLIRQRKLVINLF